MRWGHREHLLHSAPLLSGISGISHMVLGRDPYALEAPSRGYRLLLVLKCDKNPYRVYPGMCVPAFLLTKEK